MPTIVGRDPDTGDLGIAVETRTLAAGAFTPWARAGVGAIAVTGIEEAIYGRHGLDLLAAGQPPRQVAETLTKADPRAGWRQIALVDAHGRSHIFTGNQLVKSFSYRGLNFPDLAVTGQSDLGEGILNLMADTFQHTTGRLWIRLMAALRAGQHMVGDTREAQQHSAALLVVRQGGGYGGYDDRLIDLRIDDDPRPVEKLDELLETHAGQFLPCEPDDLTSVDTDLARAIQVRLAALGDYHGWIAGTYDAPTRTALERFAARENLEQLLRTDNQLDRRIIVRLGLIDMWRMRAVMRQGEPSLARTAGSPVSDDQRP